jgi:hypothetical protein
VGHATAGDVPEQPGTHLGVRVSFDLEGRQWEFSQFLRIVEPEAWGA